MLTKEDVNRANKLFQDLKRYEESLESFSMENVFHIGCAYSTVHVPLASDIAKQIGYKYYNDEIFKIKQELADMGFSCEEKKEAVQEPFKATLYSEALLERQVELEDRIAQEDLAKKYEGTYGKWPKEVEDAKSLSEELEHRFLNGGMT